MLNKFQINLRKKKFLLKKISIEKRILKTVLQIVFKKTSSKLPQHNGEFSRSYKV